MDRVLIIVILFLIMYIDIKKLYIPNTLNILLLVIAVYYKGRDYYTIENSIFGMGVYTLPLLILYGYISDLVKREIFGFGDIKLILSLGYILGYSNFYDIYLYYVLVFILGALIGIVFGVIKKDFKGEFPFSPFLIIVFLYLWVG